MTPPVSPVPQVTPVHTLLAKCTARRTSRPRSGIAGRPGATDQCNAMTLVNAPSSDHQSSEQLGIVPSDHPNAMPPFGIISCPVVRLPCCSDGKCSDDNPARCSWRGRRPHPLWLSPGDAGFLPAAVARGRDPPAQGRCGFQPRNRIHPALRRRLAKYLNGKSMPAGGEFARGVAGEFQHRRRVGRHNELHFHARLFAVGKPPFD